MLRGIVLSLGVSYRGGIQVGYSRNGVTGCGTDPEQAGFTEVCTCLVNIGIVRLPSIMNSGVIEIERLGDCP
jgi:hypothetical protein